MAVDLAVLVEVVAAIKHGLPIVMKTGRLAGRRFEADKGMTKALVNIVDVAQAEAAVTVAAVVTAEGVAMIEAAVTTGEAMVWYSSCYKAGAGY